MKISKVNHAKSAVRVTSNGQGQEGFIYIDPSKKGEAVARIDGRVESRTRQAQKLYNIFNAFEVKKEEERVLEIIYKAVNGTRNEAGLGRDIREKCGFDVDKVKNHISNNDMIAVFKEDVIDCAISKLLRKSLSHDESKKGLRNILLVYFGCLKWSDSMKESVTAFLETYHADYEKSYSAKGRDGKKKQSKNEQMKKAVKNQNMIVQPSKKDNSLLVLSEASKSNNRKKAEKEAFSAFVSDYANLSDDYRKELRIKLRRLLVLYFYGVDDASTLENEWDDHEKRKDTEEFFSKVTVIKTQDKDGKPEKKTIIDSEDLRRKNMAAYRNAISECENDTGKLFFSNQNINKFWIHHFENAVERITDNLKERTVFRLKKGYLSEKVWKDAINLLSIKYIAIGKAVYNFALDGISEVEKDRKLGELDSVYRDGISSFEYEQIKAEETLQRELSVYIAFAANNLGRATVNIKKEPEKEDFMLYKKESTGGKNEVLLKDVVKPGLRRNILQFFGGQSTWEGFDFDRYYHGDDIEMLSDMKEAIYALRNESFHFETFNTEKSDWNAEAIGAMFAHESVRCSALPKDKFYSNNLNMFYKEQDLRKILDVLYSKYAPRASQVPSFNSVFVRKNFPSYLRDELHVNPAYSQENASKFQSAVYYLFKEIYYNCFLQDKNVKETFYKAVKKLKPKSGDEEKSRRAIEDFSKRIKELYEASYNLPQICQIIMTEQNQQNNKRKVQSAKASDRNPEIFRHYKLLLYKSLIDAFTVFINRGEFAFIKSPVSAGKIDEQKAAEVFLADWKAGMYKEVAGNVSKDSELQKWYICGRMLNGRQLNLLVGSMRSYSQYSEDVRRRAEETKSPLKAYDRSLVKKCEKRLEVLDLCRQLSGAFTNNFTDYFDGEDDYAAYLKNFLAYDRAGYDALSNDGAKLRAFCEEENPTGGKIGIYYDAVNPIVNKNILQAKLFGPDMLLKKIVRKVRREELEKYYKNRERIEGYRVKGACETKDAQEELNQFMELKNRIELRNVVDYGEIVNELLGQLINWSYLRERDLLYFQLGFHYVCMNNDSAKPDGYLSLTDNDGHRLDGAILHQIAALYINGLPLYEMKKDAISYGSARASAGGKIRKFASYEEDILGVTKYSVYEAGLELFENINEHDDIVIGIRNYIDHFKYYVDSSRSLLDLYSEIHDRFFTYDMKYQKNVTNMLKNILLKHFVVVDFDYATGKKMSGGVEKPSTKLVIRPEGITSDEFTYKTKEGIEYTLQARSDRYLEDIAQILIYPSKEYSITSLIGKTKTKKVEDSDDSRGNKYNSGKKKKKYKDENREEYEKYSKENRDLNVGNGIMGEAFKNIKL